MSDSAPGQLFSVEGMVIVITGGATGRYHHINIDLTQYLTISQQASAS